MRSGLEPTLVIKMYEIFVFIKGVIEWPSEDEAPPEDARDLVTRLLEQDPIVRLGTTGVWKSVVFIFVCLQETSHLHVPLSTKVYHYT